MPRCKTSQPRVGEARELRETCQGLGSPVVRLRLLCLRSYIAAVVGLPSESTFCGELFAIAVLH
jgi:hypothetical protein